MTTFNYIIRDTGRLLVRHWFLGILTLITAAVMMWILGLTTLFSLNVQTLLRNMESEVLISAYVRQGGEGDDKVEVEKLAEAIRAMEPVASLQALSPDEALEDLERRMGRMGGAKRTVELDRAVALVGENPLPWVFRIRVKNASEVPALADALRAMPDIADVIYSGMVVERVSAISRVASKAAFAMFVLSIMITSLVVYNTIHISLYSRREEIAIMFLVGATRSYISVPFVLEGTALAVVGSILAVVGVTSAYFPGVRLLQESLPFLDLVEDVRIIWHFGVLLIGFGATLGWICSSIVVTRFMSSVTKPL